MVESGVYCITNIVNNKKYIGSTIDLDKRKNEHFNVPIKSSKILQRSIKKYNIVNFKWSVLEYVGDVSNLVNREQFYIDKFKPFNRNLGYNISPYAQLTTLGIKLSKDVKSKISISLSGRKLSEQHKMNIAKKSKQRCEFGMICSFAGMKHSKESKEKISKSHMGDKNPFYGKHLMENIIRKRLN